MNWTLGTMETAQFVGNSVPGLVTYGGHSRPLPSTSTVNPGSRAAYLLPRLERLTATPPTEATGQPPQRNKGGGRRSRPEDIRGGGCPVASARSVKRQSHIHIDFIAMHFHQVTPRLRFALAHQLGQ